MVSAAGGHEPRLADRSKTKASLMPVRSRCAACTDAGEEAGRRMSRTIL